MATWPEGIPDTPLLSGYSFKPLDQTVRTAMDTGAPRVRRRTTGRLDTVNVRFQFTDSEFNIFRNWFDNTIYGGSEYFTGLNLRLGDSGSLDTYECRFIGVYNSEYIDSKLGWMVTGTLEARS